MNERIELDTPKKKQELYECWTEKNRDRKNIGRKWIFLDA